MVQIRSSWEGLILTNHHMLFRALSISTFISAGSCICMCKYFAYSAFHDLLTYALSTGFLLREISSCPLKSPSTFHYSQILFCVPSTDDVGQFREHAEAPVLVPAPSEIYFQLRGDILSFSIISSIHSVVLKHLGLTRRPLVLSSSPLSSFFSVSQPCLYSFVAKVGNVQTFL